MDERLTYSRFRVYHADPADLDAAPHETWPFNPTARYRFHEIADEPACQILYEDYLPGGDDPVWTVWTNDLHVVLSGRAEVTCWQPPLFRDAIRAVVGQGPIYLMPRGSRVRWRVLGDEPFRHFAVDFPNPGYTMAEGAGPGDDRRTAS